MAAVLREYGVATNVFFPLITRGTADFDNTGLAIVAADAECIRWTTAGIAAYVLTTVVPVHFGGVSRVYYWPLAAADMQCLTLCIILADATAIKIFEDQCVEIETYGHPAAMHPNMSAAAIQVRGEVLR